MVAPGGGPPVGSRRGIQVEEPVETPDVLPPAHHLANEALDTIDRGPALAIRDLGRPDHLHRVEQTDVHRAAEHTVGELPFGRKHGVLVGAEARQSFVDEALQSFERLCPGDRPAAVGAAPQSATSSLASSSVITSRSMASSGNRSSAGHARPSLGGGSRFSWSKFHAPPAGSSPSIKTSRSMRCRR